MYLNLEGLWLIFIFFCKLFKICRTDSETNSCEYLESHCQAFVDGAIQIYPNYADLTTPDLIKLFGYPVEEHNITTKDGYILTVYRIPYSNISGPSASKIPVFCMHGIFASSAQWFWQPANRALVFMLVDAGYDVWLGNARGTSYSQGHVSLSANNPNNLTYWDFSQFEMGKYDVPAYINYVTTNTNQPSIYFIAHSLGAQQFFIGLTLHPELKTKVRTLFALAPAVYTGNQTNPLFGTAAPSYSQYSVEVLANKLGSGKFAPSLLTSLIGNLVNFCTNSLINCGFCTNIILLTVGFDPCQANFTTLPGFLAHFPDTISAKTFSHSSQAIMTGEFRQYDYQDPIINMNKYGRPTPPHYDWNNFDVPVVLYSAPDDSLVPPKDLQKLAGMLGSNLKEFITVAFPRFNHVDFLIAKDADIYVYNHIINIMNNHTYDPTVN